MTLNEHRLLGLLGRRMEESRLGLAPLGGMTYDQHAAANGLEREPYRSAASEAFGFRSPPSPASNRGCRGN